MEAVLDDRIKQLVEEMTDGCELAREYAPRQGRNDGLSFTFESILKAVIRGANIVKLYCEKRPSST